MGEKNSKNDIELYSNYSEKKDYLSNKMDKIPEEVKNSNDVSKARKYSADTINEYNDTGNQ